VDELRLRAADLLPGVAAAATKVEPLPDGVRLTIAATSTNWTRIAAAVDRERQCCPFLRFILTVPAAGAPFTLDVTGPPGTQEYLLALAAALPPVAPK
jgi:hypothetical protein